MAQKRRHKGWRLRLMFGLLDIVDRLGLGPTTDKIASQPMAVRKANAAAPWTTLPLPADVTMVRETIAARSGPMEIKKYLPPSPNRESPRLLFLHGGGWICGGLDSLDHLCANVCRKAGCLIVSVDYRLAPETPFPGGLEDCYDALVWTSSDPSLGPLPAAGIAVMGESAGGNLAAALCVLAERRGGPAISHQTLIYPCLDATLTSPSLRERLPGGFKKKDVLRLFELYIGKASVTDPLVSPMFAENLSALPPALILTADMDTIRDDGARYAEKLIAASVPAKVVNYLGMPHGFFFTPGICPAAAEGIAEISAAILALGKSTDKHK